MKYLQFFSVVIQFHLAQSPFQIADGNVPFVNPDGIVSMDVNDDEVIIFLEKMQEGGLLPELKMSGKTSTERKQKAKKNYMKNKAKILVKRKRLRKMGKTKVDNKKREIMAKGSKTLTGKRKVKYHGYN